MKIKPFALFGLLVAATILSTSLVFVQTARAEGEVYTRVNGNNTDRGDDYITVSGGGLQAGQTFVLRQGVAGSGTCGSNECFDGDVVDNSGCHFQMRVTNGLAGYGVNGYENTLSGDPATQCASNDYADIVNRVPTVAEATDAPAGTPSGDDAQQGEGANSQTTTCAVEGIGWIICPVLTFLGKIVDQAYAFVASLLTVQPLMTTGSSEGIYQAWSAIRNIANVAFVIAFLIIIFSQTSSIGITNYGIKKMLPKLIVAAVLVNASFWICAIAVDLSNILGSSLNDLLKGFADGGIASPDANSILATGTNENGTLGWQGIVGAVIAGAAAAGAAWVIGLSALLPVLISVVFVIFTTMVVLMLRQALIVLLIVIAPLAFVAYLLPNTESLFKKWRELFQTLLIMYPLIALIFGASALASVIVMGTAQGNYKIPIQIMGAGIAIIPLFVVPFLIKTSSGILGRVGAMINNPNRGPFDRMRKGAEGYRKNRQQLRDARALGGANQLGRGAFIRRRARREAALGQRQRTYNSNKADYIADQALSNKIGLGQRALNAATFGRFGGKTQGEQLLGQMAKGGGDAARSAALASAVNAKQTIEADELKAAKVTFDYVNVNREEAQAVSRGESITKNGITLDGGDHAMRTAAMQKVIDTHDTQGVNQLLDSVANGQMDDERTRTAFADALANSSERPAYVGQSAIANIRQHGKETEVRDAQGQPVLNPDGSKQMTTVHASSSTDLAATAINNNTYSTQKVASGDKDELAFILKQAETNQKVTAAGKADLAKNATAAATDPRYAGQVSKNIVVVKELSRVDSNKSQAHEEALVQNALHDAERRNNP